ncbi:uncharacterized protein K444DRAFT_632344 [Hyaloscypha bicolor E]|uniref:BTB domain-containing protein n=1 Tax=Hyaloscypha bicolor E TaxID=1095630 RepID=A0A2J6T2G7_9HELO|nr:uncharacterized protein K444DRAFT_632344 [Hyaloscypha bicolor E]PMD57210.1 hypothetical protein K444DRAFT_632344 [Hyaloscypha bicolor E]
MPSTRYTFDPDGDLVLVLSKPTATTNAASPQTTEGIGKDATEGSPKSAAGPPSKRSKKRKREFSKLTAPAGEAEKISMIVSSKHMILASPVFKVMLQPGRFKEGMQRNAAGQIEVDLPDDDQAVMVIVPDIIHGRNSLVPKQVDMEMLTNSQYCQKQSTQRWMAISWVFGREKEFAAITRAAIIGCRANFTDEVTDLPIPEKVLEMVARNRAANISKLFDFIKQVIERYRGINVICGSAYDAMVLGSLIKGLSAAGVWPIQEPPYHGITFNELASVIADLKAVSLCDEIDSYTK